MVEGRRILLFAQNFSGAGHLVRSLEIARALAANNDVYLASGGQDVPRPVSDRPVNYLGLPAIHQRFGKMTSMEPGVSLEETMRRRRARLHTIVGELAPDFVLVEHFPFSKWDIAEDTIDLITRAKEVNDQVRIVSSVRDIPPGREDPISKEHDLRRLEMLNTHFDAALIHADSRLVKLEEHISWAGEISVPVKYTGYVSEKIRTDADAEAGGPSPRVLLSCGGDGWLPIIETALVAWRMLRDEITDGRLDVMLPLYITDGDREGLMRDSQCTTVEFHDFNTDFLTRLQAADLSISQAGYNTCTNLLETRKRAILIPHPIRYDQPRRAERFDERGLARTLYSDGLTAETLADTIRISLAQPPPHHEFDLDGATKTCEFLAEFE